MRGKSESSTASESEPEAKNFQCHEPISPNVDALFSASQTRGGIMTEQAFDSALIPSGEFAALLVALLALLYVLIAYRRSRYRTRHAEAATPAVPEAIQPSENERVLQTRIEDLSRLGKLYTVQALYEDPQAARFRGGGENRLVVCLRPRSGEDFREASSRSNLFKRMDDYAARALEKFRTRGPTNGEYRVAVSGACDLLVLAAWPSQTGVTDQRSAGELLVHLAYDVYTTTTYGPPVAGAASAGWVHRGPDTDVTLRHLVACAEVACRTKIGIVAFDDHRRAHDPLTPAMRAALKDSLASGFFQGFCLHYQPKFTRQPVQGGGFRWLVTGAEALARFVDPNSGDRCPPPVLMEFIRENRMSEAFNTWLVQTAIKDTASLNAEMAQCGDHQAMVVSINVEPVAMTESLVEKASRICELQQLERSLLEFELLEAGEIPDSCVNAVRMARSKSFNISLDDFGSERSNLDRFDRLQLDRGTIKLDRLIILKALAESSKFHRAQIAALSGVWKSHEYTVVAEGVPDESDQPPPVAQEPRYAGDDAIREIVKLGIDCIQGFVFARPMPLQDFLKELKDPAFVSRPCPASNAPTAANWSGVSIGDPEQICR